MNSELLAASKRADDMIAMLTAPRTHAISDCELDDIEALYEAMRKLLHFVDPAGDSRGALIVDARIALGDIGILLDNHGRG